jgi:hypothetical protein
MPDVAEMESPTAEEMAIAESIPVSTYSPTEPVVLNHPEYSDYNNLELGDDVKPALEENPKSGEAVTPEEPTPPIPVEPPVEQAKFDYDAEIASAKAEAAKPFLDEYMIGQAAYNQAVSELRALDESIVDEFKQPRGMTPQESDRRQLLHREISGHLRAKGDLDTKADARFNDLKRGIETKRFVHDSGGQLTGFEAQISKITDAAFLRSNPKLARELAEVVKRHESGANPPKPAPKAPQLTPAQIAAQRSMARTSKAATVTSTAAGSSQGKRDADGAALESWYKKRLSADQASY